MTVSAHDVANVNTPGFEQSDLIQVERSPGTAAGAIRRTANPDPNSSGTDLAKEFGGEMSEAQSGYTANLKVIKVQDEMLGSLMDLKG
jgi:flagellar basal-body rod protein FlgC